jgi:hypothetical protein
MSDMSNYLENALINATFRNTAYTSSATVYVALYTAVTDAEAGTGTEVPNSNSYARTAVTFGAPSNGVISNSSDCTFPAANGGNWGTVSHFCIHDSGTYGAGNALSIIKTVTASKAVNDGDTAKFTTANLSVTFA